MKLKEETKWKKENRIVTKYYNFATFHAGKKENEGKKLFRKIASAALGNLHSGICTQYEAGAIWRESRKKNTES